jgi:diguanylate cyclase (GGDEF)-like protein
MADDDTTAQVDGGPSAPDRSQPIRTALDRRFVVPDRTESRVKSGIRWSQGAVAHLSFVPHRIARRTDHPSHPKHSSGVPRTMEVTQDILLPVLLAAIVANTTLLVLVVAATRAGRRSQPTRSGSDPVFEGSMLSTSFVDRTAQSTWEGRGGATGDDAAAEPEAADAAEATADDDVEGHLESTTLEAPLAATDDAFVEDVEVDPTAGVDPMTGLLDGPAFQRLILTEDLRLQRYHRPVTIVLFELDGLDRLTDRLGPDAADRVVPALADTIRRLARKPDRVARLAPGRFAIIMSETDEVAAINYVERVRRACELWLESGAIALRLAAGWAGTTGDPTLPDAARVATDRMYVELRRQARRSVEAIAER